MTRFELSKDQLKEKARSVFYYIFKKNRFKLETAIKLMPESIKRLKNQFE